MTEFDYDGNTCQQCKGTTYIILESIEIITDIYGLFRLQKDGLFYEKITKHKDKCLHCTDGKVDDNLELDTGGA